MRFCYLCSGRLDKQDAIKIHTQEVVQNLAALGHEVTLITPRARILDLADVPIIYTPTTRNRLASTLYNAGILFQLPRYTSRARPDLYYVRQFNKCATPLLLARLFRRKVVLEVNGIIEDETEVCGRRLSALDSILIALAYREAARIIAVTPQIRDHLIERYGVPAERIKVVPNGVNPDQFYPLPAAEARRRLGLDPAVPIVGFIGNFASWQGIDLFLRAIPGILRVAPATRFLVVGSGEDEEAHRGLARSLGIAGAVRFTGQVPVRESVLWINAFDVGVSLKRPLRSGYSPLKLYSYLACGRPVVATRTQGFEVLEAREMGALVDPFDAAAVSAACLRLLQDPALRERMGANGRRYAIDACSWRRVAEQTAQACAEAVARPAARPAAPPARGPAAAMTRRERVRLLLVIDSMDVGGAEKQFLALVRRLDRSRYDVSVCLTVGRGRLFDRLRGYCDRIHVFEKQSRVDFAPFLRLVALLRECPVDILHSFLYYSNNLCKLASLAAPVPILITSQRGSYDRTMSRAKQIFDQVTNRFASLVTTNSDSIRRYQVERLGMQATRIEAIANGLDLREFPLPATDGYPSAMVASGRFALATVGRLDPFKGYSYLFEALEMLRQRYPGVSLRIAGEGPMREELEAETRRRGIAPAVTFLGYHPDVPTLLSESYAFVLASLAEGMPNVVLESMAMQRPVVATAVDGVTEVVVPGETGFLVPPRDPVSLARAIEELIRAPERARAMGIAGRSRIGSHFDIEATVLRIEGVYRRLWAERGRKPCASCI